MYKKYAYICLLSAISADSLAEIRASKNFCREIQNNLQIMPLST